MNKEIIFDKSQDKIQYKFIKELGIRKCNIVKVYDKSKIELNDNYLTTR